MATQGPSPSKLVEDSSTTASAPEPSGNQQALKIEDVIEFVEPLPNELQCPLCLEFLKEPTLTSCCGHHFCRECIDHAITRSHVCPLCNDQGFQTLLNKEKQRVISTLKVYCKRKSRGCEWVSELGRLEHHLDVEEGDCGCVEVECEFGPVGCVAKLPRKDLQRHKEENVHKHLVLMSVMSLKSNDAFVRKLREQRVEFQQQLKQKDEKMQSIRESLQQQVEIAQELGSQLQQKDQQIADVRDQLLQLRQQRVEFPQQLKQEIQAVREPLQHQLQKKDQQIADIRDQLLQRGEQIATLQQNVEQKQRLITNLERQLNGEAERLARVEVVVAENAQQFVKMERRLEDRDQKLATYERENEKRLGDVERIHWEEKDEVGRRVAEVDKKVEQAKIKFQEGCNQTAIEITDLRKRVEQMETSLGEERGQVNEKLEANEKRLGDIERNQQGEINRQLTEVDEKVEVKRKALQDAQTEKDQMDGLRRRIAQMETSFAEDQSQVKEKVQNLEERLVTPDFTMTDFEWHKKDDNRWHSPPFYSHTGGYKMCLKVNANGQGSRKGTHVSIYVHLMHGEHDDHLNWPFRGDITVQLLNQRKEEEHVERIVHFDDRCDDECSARVTGRERAVHGWGYRGLIAHSALGCDSAKNTEYLRNDCLKFRVTNIKLTNF